MIKQKKKIVDKTYEEVYKEWGKSRYKRVSYKEEQLRIVAVSQVRNSREFTFDRVLYIGECSYYPKGKYNPKRKSFESIHYDKVIAKFERFVDEYCTDWVVKAVLQYKGYEIKICREVGCKEFYFGSVQFHKNSTFKHIADTREEVERCCKNRIDKVIYEKEKVSRVNQVKSGLEKGSKKYKIKELEELLARISTQLEELKKEEDLIVYKEVVLEVSRCGSGNYYKGTLKNVVESAPFLEFHLEDLKKSFEKYVDNLEDSYNLYRKLTGKES